MGIPSFFRWIAERYPLCIRRARTERYDNNGGDFLSVDTSYPNPNGLEFDNFYIDLNGVIHPCFHPEGLGSTPKTYEEVFEAIYMYIDRLFSIVRPRKLLFLAIDGVAPRAKMNQQRSRRFKAAKEAADAHSDTGKKETDEQTRELNSKLSEPEGGLGNGPLAMQISKELDSNVVTPGTEFMELLSSALQTYISKRIDNLHWSGIKVILSDSNVPGEGEHKIMSYIRLQRNLPGYDPNIRHCIYGLDADLIMLGLASHEINFSILREDTYLIKATRKRKRKLDRRKEAQTNKPLKQNRKGKLVKAGVIYDLECYIKELKFQLVNIWVLREYLALDMGAADSGIEMDVDRLIDDFVLLCMFVGNDFLPNLPGIDISEGAINVLMILYKGEFVERGGYLTNNAYEINLERLEHLLRSLGSYEYRSFPKLSKRPAARKDWKLEFYVRKFGVERKEIEQIQRHAVSKYIEGLCWVMRYYYDGLCSWQWFYPYHYGPFASDFHDLAQLNIQFTLGKPLKPLDQLMAVLPAASAHALPKSYRKLMTDSTSPILDFYPDEYEIDAEGKCYKWQGICKLPFIEEPRLLAATAKVEHTLTVEEQRRNSFGLNVLYIHVSLPLANQIRAMYESMRHDPNFLNGELGHEIDPKLSDGMNGFICLSGNSDLSLDMNVMGKSRVISVFYNFPLSHPHIPRVAQGVNLPRKLVRTQETLPLGAVPRLRHLGPDFPKLLKPEPGKRVSGFFIGKKAVRVARLGRGMRKQDLRKQDFRKKDLQKRDMWKQDLRKKDLQKKDLRKQDLQKKDLRNQDLQKQDFQKKDLQKKDFQKKNLQKKDLQKKEWQKKDLRKQDLQKQDLQKQDLRKNDLGKQVLRKKDLRKQNFLKLHLQKRNKEVCGVDVGSHSAKSDSRSMKRGMHQMRTNQSNLMSGFEKSRNGAAFAKNRGQQEHNISINSKTTNCAMATDFHADSMQRSSKRIRKEKKKKHQRTNSLPGIENSCEKVRMHVGVNSSQEAQAKCGKSKSESGSFRNDSLVESQSSVRPESLDSTTFTNGIQGVTLGNSKKKRKRAKKGKERTNLSLRIDNMGDIDSSREARGKVDHSVRGNHRSDCIVEERVAEKNMTTKSKKSKRKAENVPDQQMVIWEK